MRVRDKTYDSITKTLEFIIKIP